MAVSSELVTSEISSQASSGTRSGDASSSTGVADQEAVETVVPPEMVPADEQSALSPGTQAAVQLMVKCF
jgi:hypothetical protein